MQADNLHPVELQRTSAASNGRESVQSMLKQLRASSRAGAKPSAPSSTSDARSRAQETGSTSSGSPPGRPEGSAAGHGGSSDVQGGASNGSSNVQVPAASKAFGFSFERRKQAPAAKPVAQEPTQELSTGHMQPGNNGEDPCILSNAAF